MFRFASKASAIASPRKFVLAISQRAQSTTTTTASNSDNNSSNSNSDNNSSNSNSNSSTAVTEIHPAHQNEPLPAEVLSGAPIALTKRTVRIYRPANNPMQSGKNANLKWRLDFDGLEKGDRWSNPLMGWQSTADAMAPVRLDFASKEDAVHFAEKQGWGHFVQEPNFRQIKPKSYKNNFVYRAGKLPFVHTK